MTAGVQMIQDVIEDLDQGNLAFITSFGGAEKWSDMLIELFFGYTDRDSAHGKSPLDGFFSHVALSLLLYQIV